jgi:hypothetical protein
MKKALFLIGAVVLVMALATPSMAQFKTWGHIEFNTEYKVNQQNHFNNGTTSGQDNQETKYIAARTRFYLQYGDPKTVRAVLGFEIDGQRFGYPAAASNSDANKNNAFVQGTDQIAVEVKWAFLEFVIPHTPLVAQIGDQGWYFGGRLFSNEDNPGIRLTADFSPHKIQAFWWRENDQSNNTYNVNDLYGLDYRLAQKLFNIEAYFAYYNNLLNNGTAPNYYADHPWFAGVGGDFRPGNWNFHGQFSYVGGNRDYYNGTPNNTPDTYQAYAAELSGKYQIGPGLFVGAGGFYSTGNDADDNSNIKEFRLVTNDECRSNFGNWVSVFYYRSTGVFGPWTYGYQDDFWGTWYANVNAEYNPTPWLKLVANYLYIGDTANGSPANASASNPINGPSTSNIGARQDADKDQIGQEINLIASLQIYKGFIYNIGFGYFFPGDVFEQPNQGSLSNGYALMSRLIYAF